LKRASDETSWTHPLGSSFGASKRGGEASCNTGQKPGEIFLSQNKCAIDVLRRFGMLDCNSMTTPMISNQNKLHDQATGSDPEDPTIYRRIIGSLVYLVHTRTDVFYTVNALSQFMCEPKHIHMVVAKHIPRYV
jgi:hypothetical protein